MASKATRLMAAILVMLFMSKAGGRWLARAGGWLLKVAGYVMWLVRADERLENVACGWLWQVAG